MSQTFLARVETWLTTLLGFALISLGQASPFLLVEPLDSLAPKHGKALAYALCVVLTLFGSVFVNVGKSLLDRNHDGIPDHEQNLPPGNGGNA